MVFLFILDVITSATLHIVVSCGSWFVCKSANGVCYLYSKLKNKQPDTSASASASAIAKIDEEYVVITREEYNRIKSECSSAS